jgi:hypothetical protein
VISNAILAAVAVGLGLDPDEVSDADVEALVAGQRVLVYGLDSGGELIVCLDDPA